MKQLATLSEDSETPIEGQICMTDQVIFNFSSIDGFTPR